MTAVGPATVRSARTPAPSPWSAVGRSAGSKLLVMAVSGAVSILTIRLVIGHFGVHAYAQYGLLVSMAALLPFADLGLASVVINAVAGARDPDEDETVRRTLVSALRLLAASSAAIVLVGSLITITGQWSTILGSGLLHGSGPRAAFACLVVFACTLPLGVGPRVLTGLGLNHLQILVQGLASPLFAASVLVLVATGARAGGYLAVCSYLGGTVITGAGCVIAARRLPRSARQVLSDVPHLVRVPSTPVLRSAWPVLVQMVALPVAMQTDRLLLSHLAPASALAQYNVAFSLFSILLQTTSAAGVALWPVFARARSASQVRSPLPMTGVFSACALALGIPLAVSMPRVAAVVSHGLVTVTGWLLWGFVAFVVVQAAKYPLGMYMTDEQGLRRQVVPIVAMVPLNLSLSWWLVGPLGAGGPIIGSVVSVAACQLLPSWVYVRRDLRRRRAAAPTG